MAGDWRQCDHWGFPDWQSKKVRCDAMGTLSVIYDDNGCKLYYCAFHYDQKARLFKRNIGLGHERYERWKATVRSFNGW